MLGFHIGFQIMTRLMQNKAEIPFMNSVDPVLLGVVCLFIASKLDEMDDQIPFFNDL